jgi:hypothetical protein
MLIFLYTLYRNLWTITGTIRHNKIVFFLNVVILVSNESLLSPLSIRILHMTIQQAVLPKYAILYRLYGGFGGCSVFSSLQFLIVAILLVVSSCVIYRRKGEIVSFRSTPKIWLFLTKSFFPKKSAKGYHQGFFSAKKLFVKKRHVFGTIRKLTISPFQRHITQDYTISSIATIRNYMQ